ncbi:TPA: hypothetical protein JZG45_005081 [Escherichia coli]|nr:hypothetical protein [Escherichia coli]
MVNAFEACINESDASKTNNKSEKKNFRGDITATTTTAINDGWIVPQMLKCDFDKQVCFLLTYILQLDVLS